MNKNDTVIIAAFSNEHEVEATLTHLQEWDERVRDVKLGTILLVRMVEGVVENEVLHRSGFGSFFDRQLPISKEAVNALAQELGDRIAVVVACDDYEAGMVTDLLTRDGGRIMVNTYERTPEEIAEEAKNVGEALDEAALRSATQDARLSSGRNNNPPV